MPARICALALALCVTLPVAASEKLRPAVKEIAADVKKFLDDRKESAVSVGQFTGPPSFDAGGPGLALVLQEELKKVEIDTKKRAPVGIKGEFSLAEVPDASDGKKGKQTAVKIKVAMVDPFGNPLGNTDYQRVVDDEADIAQITGIPVEIPPDANPKQRKEKLREAVTDPKSETKGTRIAAGADGKYAIEIVVDGKPAPPKVEEGLAFVPIAKDQTYAVRLFNDTGIDAAARLTIDGVNVFAFSELRQKAGPKAGEPLYDVYLVPAGKPLLVKGWHRTNDTSDEFLVTDFAKSAAAKALPATPAVGTITATFAAAWEGDTPPDDEPNVKKGDATGFGKSVDAKFKEVRRTVGVVRSSVSVRYTK